jgi:hypothetical protein
VPASEPLPAELPDDELAALEVELDVEDEDAGDELLLELSDEDGLDVSELDGELLDATELAVELDPDELDVLSGVVALVLPQATASVPNAIAIEK